ncbi:MULTISPECIES: Cof-type HAD-IIB family hydrolase [unclassified Leuconostoc]|uniref:Cof-type HAD-IIB family hydrolase n=1 Tax=unclassified Leuconostoc TaxID=2685106 RepID=UPI0019051DB6|nr:MULTISPECIES: Cof-type HAD-IIB family hydrolase [unclassified Leuconostoc]MBK0040752.1 Cof-type HAD-IIB family hydrolase [Leuconostoc sp. S51]MBK0051826.1 Cof-type HAD-IIB family hydrolase [Leuconostoc sp. S50]
MLKLVLTDLDGTFLNSTGHFDHELFASIKSKLDNKEIAFATVTGKQAERVEELFNDEKKDIWILGDSATRIKLNGDYIYESLLPNEIGKMIIKTLKEHFPDTAVIAVTKHAANIERDVSETDKKIIRGSYAVVKPIRNVLDITDDFVKITVFDSKKRAFNIIEAIKKYNDKAFMVASEDSWIDITNFNVHKGTTVSKLQDILNITREETIAFGDGYNDYEMYDQSGISFAMSNAFPEVKEKADWIIKSNDENAVLTTIEKILFLLT